MNKLLKYIFCSLIIIFIFYNKILSQITCEINVEVSKYNRDFLSFEKENQKTDEPFFYIFSIHVTQTLLLQDNYIDSISLNLENISDFNQIAPDLFFHNLSIFNEQNIQLKYNFDGKNITIKNIEKTKKIILQYDYQSDFFIKNASTNTIFFFQPQIYEWHSWFFTHRNIKINKITFNIPSEEAYFFADNSIKINNNQYVTNFSNENYFVFYLLNEPFYIKKNFKCKTISVNLLFNKGVEIDTIFERVNPIENSLTAEMRNYIEKTEKSIEKISNFFDYKDSLTINIADAYLDFADNNDKKYAWGKLIECSTNNKFICIDTSFWTNHSLNHEIIHAFNKNELSEKDSTYFFFGESIVEYLAICFFYNDPIQQDSVFNHKINYFNSLNTAFFEKSIFKIQSNSSNFEDGYSGTMPLIYEKTPYLIHKFAKTIGEEKFLKILQQFYVNSKIKNNKNFEDLMILLQQNGVSNMQFYEFVEKL